MLDMMGRTAPFHVDESHSEVDGESFPGAGLDGVVPPEHLELTIDADEGIIDMESAEEDGKI